MIVSGLCLAMVSGCAARPSQIDGTYVSPAIYKDYTCDQLLSERRTIVENVRVITKQQADKAGGDAVAVGVGVVLFWPALFLLAAGKDREAELASYKGNYDAITKVAIEKKCLSQDEIRREEEAYKEAQKRAKRDKAQQDAKKGV